MTEPTGPAEDPRPGRRDILRGVAAVGAFLAVDAAALLAAFDWIGARRLTPQAFLDAFNNAFGRHHGYRTNHAKGVAVAGWFDSNGTGAKLSTAAVFAPGRTPVIGRFSGAGGNPHTADSPATGRGLGLAFGFPDAQLYWVLRQAHSVIAYTLMAVIAAHVSAVLLHTLTLRDRLIERMTFRFRSKGGRSRA